MRTGMHSVSLPMFRLLDWLIFQSLQCLQLIALRCFGTSLSSWTKEIKIGNMRVGLLLTFWALASASVLEILQEIPEGWRKVATPFPEERLLLRIAMHSPNQGLFEQTLYRISDPANDRYGKHLKREELENILRPTSEATALVTNWLLQSGVNGKDITDDGEWISFAIPVDLANKLLETEFAIYESRRGDWKTRTLQYSVPSELDE